MSTQTISVVIPCFNVEAYVHDAITSVLDQAPPLHEVLIIDDGSTDGTSEVLQQFVGLDRVQIRRTANRGLGLARNCGLEMATGDYVYFLDSDDLMAPAFSETLQRVFALKQGRPPDMVCFSGVSFMDEGYTSTFLPDYTRQVTGSFADGGSAGAALFQARCFFPNAYLYVSSRLLWIEHGLRFKPIIHEDQEVLMPLFAAAREVEVLADVLYKRRVRGGSIMTSKSTERILTAHEAIVQSLLDYPVDSDQSYAPLRPAVAHRLSRSTRRYLSTADELGFPLNWSLMFRAVTRLRSGPVTARLVKVAARSTVRNVRRRLTGR